MALAQQERGAQSLRHRQRDRRDRHAIGKDGDSNYVWRDTKRSQGQAMTLPDRLSMDPRSPFFDAELLQKGVGIRFKGVEKTNVEEYCVSEGWIRVAAGSARDRAGNPVTIKLSGEVEPFLRDG